MRRIRYKIKRKGTYHPKTLQKNQHQNCKDLLALENIERSVGMVGLSVGEKYFIQGGIAQDLHSDGRERLTYRPTYIETGVNPEANGSARVKMGATEVITIVKAELGEPSPSRPDKGRVAICVDCSPTAALMFEAALSNTAIPKVHVTASAPSDQQPEVDISDEEFLQFDTSGVPVIVTLTKVGRHYIADATSKEESQMNSTVSISINRQGRICGLIKQGVAGLDPSVIQDMISVAKHLSKQLINKLDSEIGEACEEES